MLKRPRLQSWFVFAILVTASLLTCLATPGMTQTDRPACFNSGSVLSSQFSLPSGSTASDPTVEHFDILQQSWLAYRDRFIQADGRVIDREANDRTVSEGQAYAMLRAVMINDPDTFVRTLTWAENNLSRQDEAGNKTDSLWAWKWGRTSAGEWRTIDANFASDADLDAVTALILASRRWNCPELLELAQTKLQDLWQLSTRDIAGQRYFLPGSPEVFQPQPDQTILNPSYLAPYAFRLFAQVDGDRDWLSLVDSSYDVLNQSAALSEVNLPSDWVVLNAETGEFQPLPAGNSLKTQYGFDAYRVWWRIAWDAAWFEEPRADRYLQQHLPHLQQLWQNQQQIPALLDLQGQPIADYEATSQYAMLHYAFQVTDPELADQIYQQKLMPPYRNGFWDSDSAYYAQNLAWFGLLPAAPPNELLQAEASCNVTSSMEGSRKDQPLAEARSPHLDPLERLRFITMK